MFKAFGNHRLSAYGRGEDKRTVGWFRLVFMTKTGRVFRVSPSEWDHDRKFTNIDPRYRPYRQGILWFGPLFLDWAQKRPGLGMGKVLREWYVERLVEKYEAAVKESERLEAEGANSITRYNASQRALKLRDRIYKYDLRPYTTDPRSI